MNRLMTITREKWYYVVTFRECNGSMARLTDEDRARALDRALTVVFCGIDPDELAW